MTTHTTKNALLRLLSILLLVFAAFAGQARALEVPPRDGLVNDRAGMMPEGVTRRLEEHLRDAEQKYGVWIAGLTIPTLAGEDPAKFAERTAAAWGLDKGDGRWVLLLVAEREEAIRIATGRGVADKLTAELGVRIVAEEMRPFFKAGEAGRGVAGGLLALPVAAVLGEFEPSDRAREYASAQAAKPAGRAAAKPAAQPAAPPAPQPAGQAAAKPAAQPDAQPAAQAAEQAAALVVAQTVMKPAGQAAAKPVAQPAAPPAASPADDPDDGQGLKVPRLTGPVNDLAGVLSPETRARLDGALRALKGNTGIQLVLLTIPSLKGEVLEEFALRTAEAWGLGKKGDDKGVLFLVAMKERKSRIEVGYGLEGTLTDLLCSRIIREEVAPAFRAGHPGEGVAGGVAALMEAAQTGKFSPSEAALGFAKMAPAETAPAKPAPAETAPAEASGGEQPKDGDKIDYVIRGLFRGHNQSFAEGMGFAALRGCIVGLIMGYFLGIFSLAWWWVPGVGGALVSGGAAAMYGCGVRDITASAVFGLLAAVLFAKLFMWIGVTPSFSNDDDDDDSSSGSGSSSSSGGSYSGGGGGFGGGGASGSL